MSEKGHNPTTLSEFNQRRFLREQREGSDMLRRITDSVPEIVLDVVNPKRSLRLILASSSDTVQGNGHKTD